MGKVRNILDSKHESLFTVPPDITVYKALELMCERNMGAVIVEDDGRLSGIFTERDYARKVALKGRSSKETLVRELMTLDPITINSDTSVDQCMALMNDKRIRHLPVVDGATIKGVISVGDIIRYMIEEQRTIIEHLESYITH